MHEGCRQRAFKAQKKKENINIKGYSLTVREPAGWAWL
jgi:hypothetical protein